MAVLDPESGRLVVRIAYDGPPLAGKTATLNSLGAALSTPVDSFEGAYGRTLWFDWMRYRGGLYEGHPIDCEVVALPGQRALEHRRRRLLGDADAIVFVADVSRPGQIPTVGAYQRLRDWVVRHDDVPVPRVVVQANKRDLDGSWSAEELRRALHLDPSVPVVESIATDQVGVRHAFVFAVGAAVRRATEQRALHGVLPHGPGPRTGQDVYRWLAAEEGIGLRWAERARGWADRVRNGEEVAP